MNRWILLSLAALCAVGCVSAQSADKSNPPTATPATQPAAVDLGNTVCPVSGDQVGDSKLTQTYKGKIYHFCCDECLPAFQKDPDKFAKAVAEHPDKFGVKVKS
jgi:YHS domain-containing protein